VGRAFQFGLANHAVEGPGQPADLVARGDRDAGVERTILDHTARRSPLGPPCAGPDNRIRLLHGGAW